MNSKIHNKENIEFEAKLALCLMHTTEPMSLLPALSKFMLSFVEASKGGKKTSRVI